MRALRQAIVTVAAAGCVAISHSAWAQQPVEWQCSYNNDTTLTCVLKTDVKPDAETLRALGERLRPDAGHHLGLAREGRLPALVQALQDMPEALAGRRVSIPLYTDPDDIEFLRALADAVICGNSKRCTIALDLGPI